MNHIRNRRVALRLTATGAVVALAAAACGGGGTSKSSGTTANFFATTTAPSSGSGGGTPAHTTGAGLLDQPGFEATFSLNVTPDQISQMQAIDAKKSTTSSKLSTAEIDALAKGSISIAVHSTDGSSLGKVSSSGKSANEAFDMALHIGTDTPFDLRVIGKTLFLKVALQQVLSDTGQNPASGQKYQSELQGLDAQVHGLAALASGSWVSTDLTPLEQLANTAGGASSTTLPAAAATNELKKVEQAISANTTSTKVGDSGGRTEYNVTVNVAGLSSSLGSAVSSLPGVGSTVGKGQQKLSGAKSVTVQAYEKNGKLVEVDVDLNQFSHTYPFAVPLRIQLGAGSTIAAPGGATSIDLTPLLGSLGSLGKG